VITYLFVADCVEYGAYKIGIRAAGISFSLQTFVSKIKSSSLIVMALFYKLRDKSVKLMSKYNAGELSREKAEKVLAGRFGKAGLRSAAQ
jgi:hypothetical protein